MKLQSISAISYALSGARFFWLGLLKNIGPYLTLNIRVDTLKPEKVGYGYEGKALLQ